MFIVLFALACRFLIRQSTLDRTHTQKLEIGFAVLLLSAFLLRLFLAPVIEGYPYDMGCFKTWSFLAADKGLPDFYADLKMANYPPGYIYILYLIGLVRRLWALPTNATAFIILLKLPSLLTDMIAAWLIYRVGRIYTKSVGAAAVLALLYAFNPVVIHNSTFFGQVDSFFTLFLLLCLLFIERRKLTPAAIFYALAVLIKPQALIFAPLGLFALIEVKNWRTILTSLLAMLGTFLLLIIPFSLKQTDPFWIIKIYQGTLGTYEFSTLNAFNLYALLGANLAPLSVKFLFLSIRDWSTVFLVLILACSTFIYIRNFRKQKNGTWPFFLALFLITAFFMLVHNMHERYLYPAIALSLLCYIVINDRRFLFIFLGLTITNFFNQEIVLYLAYNYDITQIVADHPLEYNSMRIFSAVNLGLFVYLIKIGWDIYLRGRIISFAGKTARHHRQASRPALQRNDNNIPSL
jgi:Gpi18-like mannosyltransferase